MASSSGVRFIQSLNSVTRASPPLHNAASFRQPLQQYMRSRAFHATAQRQKVQQITSQQEFQETIKKHEFVVLDAFAEWCGPCKAIAPMIEAMSDSPELNTIVHFAKFDVDQLPELTSELGVRAMPTFVLFQDGKKMDDFVGADPKGLLKKILYMVT